MTTEVAVGFRLSSASLLTVVLVCVQGPQIISVPQFDTPRRYWIVPFVDNYFNFWGAIGSDFNSSAGDYLVVGRGKPWPAALQVAAESHS